MRTQNEANIAVYRVNDVRSAEEGTYETTTFYDPATKKAIAVTHGSAFSDGRSDVEVHDLEGRAGRQQKLEQEGFLVELSGQEFYKIIEMEAIRRVYSEAESQAGHHAREAKFVQEVLGKKMLESRVQRISTEV